MNVLKYFKVTCKCGHTGSRKTYIPITFPVVANNGKEAASIAREKPRCKHHHKDCVQKVEQCTLNEFLDQIKENKNNPYLSCRNIQEQKMLGIEDQFVIEPKYSDELNEEEDLNTKPYYYRKKKIKHPKKYMTNIYDYQSRLVEAY